ncbi:MAG: TauD/TfdA family dioxygenase [Bryobacteraceae bacterium]
MPTQTFIYDELICSSAEVLRLKLSAALSVSGLLIIKGFPRDDDELMAFASHFGGPELVYPPQFRAKCYPHVRIQSNIPGIGVSGGGEYWHSDGPWSATPSSATLLLCFEASEITGSTHFVDMRDVYSGLPQETQRELKSRIGLYPCRSIYENELALLGLADPEKLTELRDLTHPLVRKHPTTGQQALYLNEKWLTAIADTTESESRALMDRLYGAVAAHSSLYVHRWNAGDLLVWDNVSMIHKARPTPVGSVKITHRVTIAGV